MEVSYVMNKTTATQNGFTLVETLASIVLLVIILLSFTQLFVQTNKAANINNEKLVVINLADGILEGLKAKPMKEIKNTSDVQDYFKMATNPAAPPNTITFNEKAYTVSYAASQGTEKYGRNSEVELKIMKVVVTVTAPDGKTKSSTEGYVSIE